MSAKVIDRRCAGFDEIGEAIALDADPQMQHELLIHFADGRLIGYDRAEVELLP